MTQALMDVGPRVEAKTAGPHGKHSGAGASDSGAAFADAVDQAIGQTSPGAAGRTGARSEHGGGNGGTEGAARGQGGRQRDDHDSNSAAEAGAVVWALTTHVLPGAHMKPAGAHRAAAAAARTVAGGAHDAAGGAADAGADQPARPEGRARVSATAARGAAELKPPAGSATGKTAAAAERNGAAETDSSVAKAAANTTANTAANTTAKAAVGAAEPAARTAAQAGAAAVAATATDTAKAATAKASLGTRGSPELALQTHTRAGNASPGASSPHRATAAGSDSMSTAATQASPTAIQVPTPAAATVNSTAAPVAAPAPTPLMQAQPDVAIILAQLRGSADGTYQLRARVHPAELGAVAITATVNHGALSVVLSPDPAAQQAISQSLPQLRQHLADQGFTGVNVGLGSPNQSGHGGQGGELGSRAQGSDRSSHHGQDAATGAVGASTAPAHRAPGSSSALDRLL